MDTIDLIRKIKLARKYILDQEYEQAYNETYLPPEVEETNSLPFEAVVSGQIADFVNQQIIKTEKVVGEYKKQNYHPYTQGVESGKLIAYRELKEKVDSNLSR